MKTKPKIKAFLSVTGIVAYVIMPIALTAWLEMPLILFIAFIGIPGTILLGTLLYGAYKSFLEYYEEKDRLKNRKL